MFLPKPMQPMVKCGVLIRPIPPRWRAWLAAVAVFMGTLAPAQAAGGYWAGVSRALPTSPLGNMVAVSCHNCYGNTNAATQAQVALALARDFDLVELDLTFHSDGQVYVEHGGSEDASRGTLAQALANPGLRQSNRLLFLEIKQAFDSPEASDAMMLAVLRTVRDQGYATAGRPVMLRAFLDPWNRHQHLVRAQRLLAATEFASLRDLIRLHALIENDVPNGIRTAKALGLQGVELEYRMPNLFDALTLAKQLDLGVGVYTTPADPGEVYLSALREDVDFITTDYDRAATPATFTARAVVQESSTLVYLNAAAQSAYPLSYRRAGAPDVLIGQSNGTPLFDRGPVASDRTGPVGGGLLFQGMHSITTWNAGNAANGGFLVTASVSFNDLKSGATAAIIAKSDSGGFTLEQAGPLLRFGVYVGGNYVYASVPLTTFNEGDSYFITASYDGNGAVRLWANNIERTASAPIKGGVGLNNSPIVIGADPQGAVDRRYFFNGRVQQVMVQRWHDHAMPLLSDWRRCSAARTLRSCVNGG